ncbi:MAG: UvrB/UvrC motif-containing protein [Bacillus sp. (in: Bacteria)]|jgi:protein arginine kinase activator|nr:UvrB/UvrC motif-containing protein [Bacillus sp. (in: firmicutes)]
MLCQECHERPATLHFTKIINGEKTEFHLCETCAQEKGEMFMFSPQNFSFNNLLAGLFNVDSVFQQAKHDPFQHEHVMQCPRCNMTVQQFLKIGKFGCASCYDAFRHHLNPLLKRVHSGNVVHHGKVPKRSGGNIQIKKKIEQLKGQMNELIAKEEFEKAAIVRDEIRSLEKQLEGGE